MTIKTSIMKSRSGAYALWFSAPDSPLIIFRVGYADEDNARKAAFKAGAHIGFVPAIGRTVERVQS